MIYLLDMSLITHIISYNKTLIIYHMSALETHLSNIHLNMAQINKTPPHPTPHPPNPVRQERLLQAAIVDRTHLTEIQSLSSYLPTSLA